MGDNEDRKKTVDLPRPGPSEAKTVEMATYPIILEELKGLRKDGNERGGAVKVLESAVKGALIQLQQYYELFGGKIRTLESRADTADLRAAAHEAQSAELKRQLEARLTALEKETESVRTELANLRDTKLGVSVMPGMEAKISLSEDEMAKKLEEEAAAHQANLDEEIAEREALDKKIDARLAPTELKMDVLLKALNVKPPPPPNPDGSIPPGAEKEKKKQPKNAIEKQATLVRVAVILMGAVGTGGVLDKIGLLDALGRYFAKLWH